MFTNPKKLLFFTLFITVLLFLLIANSPGGYVIFGWLALGVIVMPLYISGVVISIKQRNNLFLILNILFGSATLLLPVSAIILLIAWSSG